MAVNVIYQLNSDQVADSGSLTVQSGTEDAAYPKANLYDSNPAKPAKLTTTTGAWRWDFGVAQRIDLVALIHHNLTAGLEVRIQGNAADAWGAPTFNQVITIPAYLGDGYPSNPWLDLTGLAAYSTGGFRYWRLVVVGTNAAAIAIGEVWLGALKRSLTPNIDWGARQPFERKTVEHRTDFGVSNIYDLGVTIRNMQGQLDTTDAQAALIQAWWRDTRGRVRPFLLVPNGDVNDAWLVRWTKNQIEPTLNNIDRNVFQMEFEEVGRGLLL